MVNILFPKKTDKKLISGILLAVLVFSIAIPIYKANAELSAEAIGESVAQWAIRSTLATIFGFMSNMIALLGDWIDDILNAPVTDVAVVRDSWELVRNFANMFFIIALILMAFGTIFSVGGYDFRSLIVRFLIAALLINFSLTIGEIIINWTYSLSYVFIQAIGDVGGRIGQGIRPGGLFDLRDPNIFSSGDPNLSAWQLTIAVFANVILLSIVLFSLAVLFIFTLIRIPILWALLIISPLAWILYILPTTKKYNRMWWDYFISWNIFLPIYLFFIYFGVLFITRQTSVGLSNTPSPIPGFGATFQTVFYYILTGLFLIGGAKIAMGFARAGGAGAVAGSIWARGRAAARFTGVGLSRRTPGINKIEPAYRAAGQRIAQFQKDSERALQQRQSAIAGRLGVRGASEQQFNKNVEEAMQDFKDKKVYDTKQNLIDIINSSNETSPRKVAAYKLLKEFHQEEGSAEQIKKVANAFRESGLTAQESKFMAGLDLNRLSKDDLDALMKDGFFLGATVPYRKQFLSRITDARIKKGVKDANQFMEFLSNYETEEDIIDAYNKTDKDFKDSLSKDENTLLYNFFGGANKNKIAMKDAQKAIASTMLKKGQFKEADMMKIFADFDKGGIYDSPLERERALQIAEETRLMSTLQIRKALGILPIDEATGNPIEYSKLADRKFSRLSADAIAKQKTDELLDESGNPNTKGTEFLKYLKIKIEQNPGLIKGIETNKDYTDTHRQLFKQMFDEVMENTKIQREAKVFFSNLPEPKRDPTKDEMRQFILQQAQQGEFSTPVTDKNKKAQNQQISAYRVLARELGYEIGKLDRIINNNYKGSITKIGEAQSGGTTPSHLGGPTIVGSSPKQESVSGQNNISLFKYYIEKLEDDRVEGKIDSISFNTKRSIVLDASKSKDPEQVIRNARTQNKLTEQEMNELLSLLAKGK